MYKSLSSQQDVVSACEEALSLAPANYPATLSLSELHGAPEWYPFEHATWAIGESIRQGFLRHPKLKRDEAVISAILRVATCRNLRRGRQSFINLLGFVAVRKYAANLAAFLSDDDVQGQVVATLVKMKAVGFIEQVRPLLDAKHAWIRRQATRYVERFPG